MSKPRKNIRWSEMPKFMPMNKSYYDKLKSFTTPVADKSSPESIKIAEGIVPNRQRLLHLIKCLAISETQRKQLSAHLEEITRQKLDLDTQLQQKEKEKIEIMNNEKNAKSILEKTCSTLEEKEKEIELLQKKLSELQKKANPKIPDIPGPVLHPVEPSREQTVTPIPQVLPANTPPPVANQPQQPLSSPMQALEEKLTIIQNEINSLTAKITMVASQTPKEVIREIIREPAILPPQNKSHSLAHAISISGDDSSLSSGQLRSIEEIPNLASLLKKILKARKVHYSEPSPKDPEPKIVSPVEEIERKEDLRSSSISRHIERLEAELSEKKRLLKKEFKSEATNTGDRRVESRNAQTSPIDETFQPFSKTQSKYSDSFYKRENYVALSEEPVPLPTKHNYRKDKDSFMKHTKPRKSKSRSKTEYSICECSTCSENVSWICPGCVSEESSIRQPNNYYFDDDTSMIRPLAEIVSDLENERTMMPSFAVVDRDSQADGELLEVISSLNGL